MTDTQHPADVCREAFEKWASQKSWYSRSRKPNGDYWDKEAQCAWETWQYLSSGRESTQGAERIRELLSENRDALQTAKQHMKPESFTGQYAHEQVTRQIEACQIAIDELSAPSHPLTPADREEAVRVMREEIQAHPIYLKADKQLRAMLKDRHRPLSVYHSEETAREAAEVALSALEAKGYVGRKG